MTALPPKRKLSDKMPSSVKGGKIVQKTDTNKTYTLNTGAKERGTKILLYAASGMGKTTLASLAPNPVFIAVDDGIDEIMHPVTGEVVPHYSVRTYGEVRDILSKPKHFDGFDTVVLDTMTEVESLAVPHILKTVTRDGKTVKSLEGFGWGAGYGHLADFDNYVKYDLQRLAELGKNIVVICQIASIKVASGEVEDYIKDAPKLVYRPGSKAFAATDFVEWADHCFKIGYSSLQVSNKRAAGNKERVIFTQPEMYFEAKARGFPPSIERVSFENPADDSIWRFVFDKAWEDVDGPDSE